MQQRELLRSRETVGEASRLVNMCRYSSNTYYIIYVCLCKTCIHKYAAISATVQAVMQIFLKYSVLQKHLHFILRIIIKNGIKIIKVMKWFSELQAIHLLTTMAEAYYSAWISFSAHHEHLTATVIPLESNNFEHIFHSWYNIRHSNFSSLKEIAVNNTLIYIFWFNLKQKISL